MRVRIASKNSRETLASHADDAIDGCHISEAANMVWRLVVVVVVGENLLAHPTRNGVQWGMCTGTATPYANDYV